MSQKKYDAFDHASHNLRAHQYIKDNGNFLDWEITTAFYTALKFFEGALFPGNFLHPGKEDSQDYKDFKSYNDYNPLFIDFVKERHMKL